MPERRRGQVASSLTRALQQIAHAPLHASPQDAFGMRKAQAIQRTRWQVREGVIQTARKRYEVVPSGSDWQVKHEGKVLSTHSLKSDAVDAGVKVAKANAPSQLVIHRADGTIEDERTYGDDPFPPRG